MHARCIEIASRFAAAAKSLRSSFAMSVTLKCVHSEGVGHLRYTSDGAHLLTAGADALVKVFDVAAGGVNSNEPKTVEHPNETVVSTLAMHPKGKGFVTGADSNQVTQFSFPGGGQPTVSQSGQTAAMMILSGVNIPKTRTDTNNAEVEAWRPTEH